MANEQPDLALEKQIDNFLSSKANASPNTKKIIFSVWDLVLELYETEHPSSITVYHHYDGTVTIKSGNRFFSTIRYYTTDEYLLEGVAYVAERSNLEGKIFLHNGNNYLNVLDLQFH